MLPGECLPMQVVGARQSRLARSLTATVLMHDDAAQRFDAFGNPDGVVDRIDERALLLGGFVAHAVVRRVGGRKDIIRWPLRAQVDRR